jgi:hypothetical protein
MRSSQKNVCFAGKAIKKSYFYILVKTQISILHPLSFHCDTSFVSGNIKNIFENPHVEIGRWSLL